MDNEQERLKIISENLEVAEALSSKLKKFDVVGLLQTRWHVYKNLLCAAVLIAFVSFMFSSFSKDERCLIDVPPDASKLFRDPESCDFCRHTRVEKVENISFEEFLSEYVVPVKPLLVSGGAKNWPAFKAFDFNFFKALFETADMNRSDKRNCQFFPYKTEFRSLQEAFSMDEDTALLNSGWYIGWSNCNDDTGRYLKSYYSRPYFLSNMSENLALSWIFMGGIGHGAHMHVDNVHYPSWQAQIKGKKLWKLAPPPECYYQCNQIEVTVEPGDIVVLDTNRWFHQTIVQPGEMSISLGSEFD